MNHDKLAVAVEVSSRQRFGEEICHVGGGGDIGHNEQPTLHNVMHEKVTAFDMLRAFMVFRVIYDKSRAALLSVANGVGSE